jgi:hypothetical protein
MKIAYDHQIFTSQVYGGISKYYYHLAKELSELGESVKIFSPFYKNKYISDLPKKIVNGRYVDHYPLNSQRIVNKYNQFVSDRSIHKYQPDIIHETFYSGRRTDKNSYKTVITVYDMIHELFDYYEPPHHRGWDAKKTSIRLKRSIQMLLQILLLSAKISFLSERRNYSEMKVIKTNRLLFL